MLSVPKLRVITQIKMTFNAFVKELSHRTGPAYGAGPVGFRRLMERLNNPQNCYQIIHVAGTNGKGSVCYLCAEVLKVAGYKTGLFVSPHVSYPTERIQFNNHAISRADFMRLCRQGLCAEEERLNFFEILTAAAFLYFAEKKAERVVLETGLGGSKDPTNVCAPTVCMISSIGLDHCQILGNTLGKIAREKAGIIKKNVPIVCPELPAAAMREIRIAAKQRKAPLCVVRGGDLFKLAEKNWQKSEMVLRKGTTRWRLHLMGAKQTQNASLVYEVCRMLNIPVKVIRKGFARVQIPGRFEVVRYGRKTVILDGAHNLEAVENLVKFMQKSPWKDETAIICAFMGDKNYRAMLRVLSKNAAALYVTTMGNPRAADLIQVKDALPRGVMASYFQSPTQALRGALQAHRTVVVTGSFYLVARVRARMEKIIDTEL